MGLWEIIDGEYLSLLLHTLWLIGQLLPQVAFSNPTFNIIHVNFISTLNLYFASFHTIELVFY